MALSKLAIYSLVGIASTIAVTGITAGVVVSQQKHSQTIDSSNPDSNKEANDEKQNDSTQNNVVLDELIKQIRQNEIIIRPLKQEDQSVDKNQKLNRNDVYSFNVTSAQLEYEKQEELTKKGLEIKLEISKTKNLVSLVNDGKLVVDLTLKQINKHDSITKSQLTLTNFKKGSESLKNIVFTKQDDLKEEDKNNVLSNNYSLVLEPKSNPSTKFVSIEDLNKKENKKALPRTNLEQEKKSGLDKWLQESKLGLGTVKNISVIGEVKLEKITNKENKAVFVLVSKDVNKPLKLIGKTEEQKPVEELLINQIETTNLLVSSLKVIPKNINQQETEKLITNLSSLSNGDQYTKSINNSLQINANGSSPQSLVTITPYSLDKKDMSEISELEIDIELSFGTKKYKTNEAKDLEELKEAGFSFQVFSKKIMAIEQSVKPAEIRHLNNKLSEFFKEANYITPSNKSSKEGMKEANDKGEFFVTSFPTTKNPTEIKIKLSDLNSQPPAEMGKVKNIIAFANYTYNGLETKVLYSPFIGLIQLPKQAEKA